MEEIYLSCDLFRCEAGAPVRQGSVWLLSSGGTLGLVMYGRRGPIKQILIVHIFDLDCLRVSVGAREEIYFFYITLF